ncbi:hypothetical protein DFA_03936 [Cavenderia fasciculata]|uniref:Uncharacterized protein n=1 Tax=Cavenderia fasciculata TaxID=261658 RepID=F4Q0U1_CACFS|nr:uncharacterized protein DFA_03936 [Cavenderia fasciculata]EGG18442.1 hypothetical protein DFA_03936 [Cavenderia fasciculata]|eukprot:XP_004366346.1 hypothetical protein DFA_03936 [Cavenderia fasciculata]
MCKDISFYFIPTCHKEYNKINNNNNKMDINTFRNVFNNRYIINTIMCHMVKIRDFIPVVQSNQVHVRKFHRYSEFNDIGVLLSKEESNNLLKYKFARGDTSKLKFEPTQQFYSSLFRATDVSLQHQIIDFLGDAFYLEAYRYMKLVDIHHSVFIKLLDYYRDNINVLEESKSPLSNSSIILSEEVYHSLLGPNKSLACYFTETFFLVTTTKEEEDQTIKLVKLSDTEETTILLDKIVIGGMLVKFMNNNEIVGKIDNYISRIVESITTTYNDNLHHHDHDSDTPKINLSQKRTEYGHLLDSKSLEKIDLLVLLDLCNLFYVTIPSIQEFMAVVYKLDDIKLIRLVLDHLIIRSYEAPLIGYSSCYVGLETFKLMSTIPLFKDNLFNWAANTLEKVKYMHTEMGYQFTALSLSTFCMYTWRNREVEPIVFYYILEHIPDKSPGFLNLHSETIYRYLKGDYTKKTSQQRIGHIDLIEHLFVHGYLTVNPQFAMYLLVQSKRLRTLYIGPLMDKQLSPDTNHLSFVIARIIRIASILGMTETLLDIVDTYWQVFKINNTLARKCLIELFDNTSKTNQVIVRLLGIVEINSLELLQYVAGGGQEDTVIDILNNPNQTLIDKDGIKHDLHLQVIKVLNTLFENEQLQEFTQVMKFIHQYKYLGLLSQLINQVDVGSAFREGRHQVIEYYMRLHYLYKDRVQRSQFYINVFRVKSLRQMIELLVARNRFIIVQHLIDKYDSRANITSILEKSTSSHSKRFLKYSKAIKSVVH